MPRTLPVPDFLGGVSQQAAPQRLPNQVEVGDNAWSSPQDGLIKRHPTLHGKALTTVVGDRDRLLAHIDRDADERYVVDITTDAVRVFNMEGTEFPVVLANGSDPDFSYLDVRRQDYLDDHEDFGTGWTVTNMLRTHAEMRSPFDKGAPRTYTVGTASVGDAYQTLNTLDAVTVGDTFGASVYVKVDPDEAVGTADLTLTLDFEDTGNPLANALFTWSGGALTLDSTSWTGTNLGSLDALVTSVGDGWYRAALVVTLTSAFYARRIQLTLPAGDAGRSLSIFGAQTIFGLPEDPLYFPDYYVDTVRGAISTAAFADTTYIANRAKEIDFTADTIPSPSLPAGVGDEAFVWVRQGGYAQRYKVAVTYDDTTTEVTITGEVTTFLADHTTPLTDTGDTAADDVDPASITTALASVLNTAIGADGTVFGNESLLVIHVDPTFEILSVDVSDSLGDEALVSIHTSVESIDDLPTRFYNRILKVTGVAQRAEDDYWVEFVLDDAAADDLAGAWEETGIGGMQTTLDASTMPHVLVRTQDDVDGTATGVPNSLFFSFHEPTWSDRLVGDTTTNPAALINEAQVEDIGFYNSRLYLVAGRALILSKLNDPGALFRETVRELLDTDPIQIEVPDSNVSNFHAALPLERALIVFSDSTVYRVEGEPNFTPSTVSAKAVLELTTDADATPRRFGDTLVAFGRANDQTTAYEILVPTESLTTVRWAELSAPAPRYIPAKAAHTAASSASGTVLVVPAGSMGELYVFQQFLTPAGERVQASWWRYPFPEDAVVISATIVRRRAALVLERNSRITLEFMDIVPLPEDSDLGYPVAIDRRLTQDQLTGAVYDSGTDITTLTVPYSFSADGLAAGAGRPVVVTAAGQRPEVATTTATTVGVYGDWENTDLYVGERYDMTVELTRPHYKTFGQDGQIRPFLGGHQRVISLTVRHQNSAHYQVAVQPPLRAESRLVWNTPLGIGATLGPAALHDGETRVYVQTSHLDARAVIENPTPFPSRILNAEWQIDVTPR